VEPNADRETARKKINSLRINYRKENVKIISSAKSGFGAADMYIPLLWYFTELKSLTLVSCSAYIFDPKDGGDMFLRNIG
jgi:hypothetical protein